MRYNAWFRWNGSALVLPASPTNGTNGFYNELFNYTNVDLARYSELERHEIAGEHGSHDTVKQMHADLVAFLEEEGLVDPQV